MSGRALGAGMLRTSIGTWTYHRRASIASAQSSERSAFNPDLVIENALAKLCRGHLSFLEHAGFSAR